MSHVQLNVLRRFEDTHTHTRAHMHTQLARFICSKHTARPKYTARAGKNWFFGFCVCCLKRLRRFHQNRLLSPPRVSVWFHAGCVIFSHTPPQNAGFPSWFPFKTTIKGFPKQEKRAHPAFGLKVQSLARLALALEKSGNSSTGRQPQSE